MLLHKRIGTVVRTALAVVLITVVASGVGFSDSQSKPLVVTNPSFGVLFHALADHLGVSPVTLFHYFEYGKLRIVPPQKSRPEVRVSPLYECTLWDNPCLGEGNAPEDNPCWPGWIAAIQIIEGDTYYICQYN